MIRARYIPLAQKMFQKVDNSILTGTVIGFHEGTDSV
tara:strand:+ start:1353 stop:1463 length:111 start_codon:yes stop_codon:yes gene_type:complete